MTIFFAVLKERFYLLKPMTSPDMNKFAGM